MRNGNWVKEVTMVFLIKVLTVPMRNGNYGETIEITQSGKVLTVPMRNGNTGSKRTLDGHLVSSYRTYEEWKL